MLQTLAPRPWRTILVALVVAALTLAGTSLAAPVSAQTTNIKGTIATLPGWHGETTRLSVNAYLPGGSSARGVYTIWENDGTVEFYLSPLYDEGYQIFFADELNFFADGWLTADGRIAPDRAQAHTFPVGTTGLTIAPHRAPHVSGRVTLPADYVHLTNRPPEVHVHPASGDGHISVAKMAADGTFSAYPLAPGSQFHVQLHDRAETLEQGWLTADGSLSADRADARIVTANADLTINGRKTPSIRGRVELPTGRTVRPGALSVTALSKERGYWYDASSAASRQVRSDLTFEATGLTAGVPHRLKLTDADGGIVNGYLGPNGTIVAHVEDAVDVMPGATDLTLRPVATQTLSGTLTVPAGFSLHGEGERVYVRPYVRDTAGPEPRWKALPPTRVEDDLTFVVPKLDPAAEYRLEVWQSVSEGTTASDPIEDGWLDAAGDVVAEESRAATFRAPRTGINITVRRAARFGGTVSFPAGFTYDPAQPPFVTPLKAADGAWVEVGAPSPVAADGSFTTDVAHSRTPHRLRLGWPDGTVQFWTGDDSLPTSDAGGARTTSTRSDVVFPVALSSTGTPAVTGTAQVGHTLTARPGTWSPAPTFTYQWLRAGTPIPGATQQTYRLTAADAGSRIAVRVTARRAGYASASATSPQSTVDRGELAPLTRPKVSGTARLGKTLKATVTAPAGASLDYQWLRGGKPVKGATSRTYRLTKKDRGKKLSVRVTATRAGYLPRSATSQKTSKIAKAVPKVKVKTTKKISRTTRPKVTVRVTTPLTTKPTGKVRITYGKRTRTVQLKARHKGKVTVRLPRLAKGKHKIRAKYTPATKHKRYLKPTKSKKLTVRVR